MTDGAVSDTELRSGSRPGAPKGTERRERFARGAFLGALPVLLLAVWCLAASGCAARSLPQGFVPPQDSVLVPGLVAHEQRTQQCGPAALASVLGYYGNPLTPAQIAKVVYRPDRLGSLNLDLALYPRALGFATQWFSGDLDGLLAAVRRETPLIVMVDQGLGSMAVRHFMVVAGYSPRGLVVLAGADRPETVGWTSFYSQWRKTDCWTLEITPGIETASTL